MKSSIKINPSDNVGIALLPLEAGSTELGVTLTESIPAGHKFSLTDIECGADVIKYGHRIGISRLPIPAGSHVHTNEVKTGLSGLGEFTYTKSDCVIPKTDPFTFSGYLRSDGRAGIRNELWIIPTVGCVNDVCKNLESAAKDIAAEYGLSGIYHFPHPYGCSQLGGDLAATRRILADLCRHPNAGGVLVVGLGCENNTPSEFKREIGPGYDDKLRFLMCQNCGDELAEGLRLIRELAEYAEPQKRTEISCQKLIVGMKCGGSDGLSGITANPVVGRFSDMLIASGGSTVLTEVPEMFGAEEALLNRCVNRGVFDSAVKMINGFKQYFIDHKQPVSENPSPGNKDGGITTLEDKSLGCVQKGGFAPVSGVLEYGDRLSEAGLNLLRGPGNDLVSATALAACGAQLILFTTGRGTPFGAPVPTIKISSGSRLAAQKPGWIDFNAGTVAENESVDSAAERLLALVQSVAGGFQTRQEQNCWRSIAIWKNGVTL